MEKAMLISYESITGKVAEIIAEMQKDLTADIPQRTKTNNIEFQLGKFFGLMEILKADIDLFVETYEKYRRFVGEMTDYVQANY